MPSVQELQKISTQVRRDIIRMTHGAESGHPGGSLGCADFLTTLYFEIMKPDPSVFTIDGIGEDLFILSNGHISPVWYSVLARYGYFEPSELATFRKIGTRLQGHPSPHDGLPGIRMASGSLGQGLSVATGAALAKKLNNDNHMVYCLTGDGELQEGQNWEAMMFAAARKVDNLIAVVDYNGKQIDGPVSGVLDLGDLKAKILSFGWKVIGMYGNDIQDIIAGMGKAKSETGKESPVFVIMTTHMGFGVDFMLDNHAWHGSPPNNEKAAIALSQLEETLGDY
jgi:transketolase